MSEDKSTIFGEEWIAPRDEENTFSPHIIEVTMHGEDLTHTENSVISNLPKAKWSVEIPKRRPDGISNFTISYHELSLFQRIVFRILGWGVKEIKD